MAFHLLPLSFKVIPLHPSSTSSSTRWGSRRFVFLSKKKLRGTKKSFFFSAHCSAFHFCTFHFLKNYLQIRSRSFQDPFTTRPLCKTFYLNSLKKKIFQILLWLLQNGKWRQHFQRLIKITKTRFQDYFGILFPASPSMWTNKPIVFQKHLCVNLKVSCLFVRFISVALNCGIVRTLWKEKKFRSIPPDAFGILVFFGTFLLDYCGLPSMSIDLNECLTRFFSLLFEHSSHLSKLHIDSRGFFRDSRRLSVIIQSN